jgi:hypothetical protein
VRRLKKIIVASYPAEERAVSSSLDDIFPPVNIALIVLAWSENLTLHLRKHGENSAYKSIGAFILDSEFLLVHP